MKDIEEFSSVVVVAVVEVEVVVGASSRGIFFPGAIPLLPAAVGGYRKGYMLEQLVSSSKSASRKICTKPAQGLC